MKKGTKLVALLLGLALMVPACTPGANPSKSVEPSTSSEAPVNYKVTISNKEELQAEWFVGDQSRKVNLEVEPKANITQLVNEGKIQITSSDPAKLAIEGQMASPVAAGEVTITVKCGESEDTVAITLQAKQTVQEKYGVEHAGTEADPFTNEEACKVAKAENYNNEDFYVKGIVSSFYHAPGSRTDGAVSFFLTPAEGKTEKFEVYKCYKSTGTGEASYLTDDDIWVGGEALAHGTFTFYEQGNQPETTGAKLVSCTGNKPQPRQTLEKTFAEVLAVGEALTDGDQTWDYYKFQAYVTVMEGNNYYLTANKGEALIPGKSDAAHQEKDIKGTNAIELYNAGTDADLKAKLTKNAKIEVTMIVKNYHGTIENGGAALTKDNVTVLQEGEPWVINYQEKTTAEALAVINALEDGKTADGYYAVSGVVVAVTSAYNAQYGNMTFTMADAATDENVLTVFRYATDAETAAKIVAGLQVVVKGQLQKYKDKNNNITPELINVKEVVFDDNGGGTGGGDQVQTKVVDFSAKLANHNAYNDTWAYGDVTVAGGANNNGQWAFVKMGGKSATISAATHPGTWIKTDAAVNYSVASITIKYVGKCYNQESEKATVKVESYSDAALATKVAETEAKEVPAITTNEGIEEVTYTFQAPQAANMYFKVCFDIINTTTYNGVVALEKVTFNAAA